MRYRKIKFDLYFTNMNVIRFGFETLKLIPYDPLKNVFIMKGHNSGTIKVRYLKIKLDLYFINLNVITKYWSNWIEKIQTMP